MSISPRYFWKIGLLGVLFALAGSTSAFAGWMGFRNDTKETIVIQETITVNGQSKQCKPQRLFTGEAVRDTQCNGPQRTINIFDPKNPNTPIYSGRFPCPIASENILYIIKTDSKGGITMDVIKTPSAPVISPKKK